MISSRNNIIILAVLLLSLSSASADFIIEGIHSSALGIPQILFLVKTDPNAQYPDHPYDEDFEIYIKQYAYLDTGASGILFSKETAIDTLNLAIEPNAVFVDVGVSGDEYFDISEPIYIGTADYLLEQVNDKSKYMTHGPWQVQVKREYAQGLFAMPYDLIGMPAMAGKVAVLNSGNTNNSGEFSADVKLPNSPDLPQRDITIVLRPEKYIFTEDPRNIPPYPVLAYNPVIDNVTLSYNNKTVKGTYLLDTGAQISIISIAQGHYLGLVDANGQPVIAPDFTALVSGVGGAVELPGYKLSALSLPTLQGYNLVYTNPYFIVHDISVYDYDKGEFVTLDGVFGSSFFCATNFVDFNDLSGLFDIASTPFDWTIIDFNNYTLNFDVNSAYPLPKDSFVEDDLTAVYDNWLSCDCNLSNNYCNGSDVNFDSCVDFLDYAEVVKYLYHSRSSYVCGSVSNPWPRGDLNRDCTVDISDVYIYSRQWLSFCDDYNANCQFADINRDGTVNFRDWP